MFRTSDTAGVVTNMGHNPDTNQDEAYDFKGNLLRGSRQFLEDHKALPDWSGTPGPAAGVFTSSTQYDALNRPTSSISPDGSVFHPTYNEANFLETVSVNLQGGTPLRQRLSPTSITTPKASARSSNTAMTLRPPTPMIRRRSG